ncbi:MAG TPA: two-component system response regulator [Elusimicrobia bacterium]|nr:two-component system response regulator [Elusimicrobiota bacterium]HBT62007.1 two-component system response regulator [Elusimicrobiota bacterium]
MPSILVVDDEPEIVTLLRFILEKDGYSVVEATNGQAALQVLGLDPPNPEVALPDLMILDIMMPVMDGYTLNTRLQDFPSTRCLPVIVLTAKGQRMRDLFESVPNVAAYVQKPFDPKMLRDLIKGILTRKT